MLSSQCHRVFCITILIQVLVSICFGIRGGRQPTASLSPDTWDPEEFSRIEELALEKENRPKPLVYGESGVVAGTGDARAVHVGVDVLRKGGNAMDACVATALADVVLSTGSHISFAGVTNLLFYNHKTGKTSNIDASWRLPNLRTSEDPPTIHTLGDSVLVPGFIAGIFEATELTKFPLNVLFEPALYFAERGFKVTHALSNRIRQFYNQRTLLRTPEGRSIFTNPATNKPYKHNEIIRQPQLAKLIRRLSRKGRGYFYRGEWAEKLVESVTSHGGSLNMNDMAEYRAMLREPVLVEYSGHLVAAPDVDRLGVELRERLGVMEMAKFGQTSDTYLTNATKLATLSAISRFSKFISQYYDAELAAARVLEEYFYFSSDPKHRGTKEEIQSFWDRIFEQEALLDTNEMIWDLLTVTPDIHNTKYQFATSGVVTIDGEGNVCSMVHSANSRPWGTGLFVQGVALPHPGVTFADTVVRKISGARIQSGLQPVIIFKKTVFDGVSRTNLTSEQQGQDGNLDNMDDIKSRQTFSRFGIARGLIRKSGKGPILRAPRVRRARRTKHFYWIAHEKPAVKGSNLQSIPSKHRRTGLGGNRKIKQLMTNQRRDTKSRVILRKPASDNRKDKPLQRARIDANAGRLFKRLYWQVQEESESRDESELGTQRHVDSEIPHGDETEEIKEGSEMDMTEEQDDGETRHGDESEGVTEGSEMDRILEPFPTERSASSSTATATVHSRIQNENLNNSKDEEQNMNQERISRHQTRIPTSIGDAREDSDMEGPNDRRRGKPRLKVRQRDNHISENEEMSPSQSRNSNNTESEESLVPEIVPNMDVYRLNHDAKMKAPEWFHKYIREIVPQKSRLKGKKGKTLDRKKRARLRPVAALVLIGQSSPDALLQYVTNIVDSGMNAKQVIDMPLFYDSSPGSHRQDVRVEKFAFDQHVLRKAGVLGQKVKEVGRKTSKSIGSRGALLVVEGTRAYGCSHGSAEGSHPR